MSYVLIIDKMFHLLLVVLVSFIQEMNVSN